VKNNIYLVGFMGSGKSTVGRELARFLGRQFVDMDNLIEKRLGLTVNEIFAARGEEFFRAEEKKLALELAASTNKVVATGGGTLLDQEVAETLKRSGLVICLFAGKDELAERLRRTDKRPVLSGGDFDEKMNSLLRRRAEIYEKFSIRVDTTNLTPQEAARKIISLLRIRQTILDRLQSQYIVIS
jgi:shikimate kinase